MPHTVTTRADLEAVYGEIAEASRLKETDRLTPEYRAFIEASPFAVLATAGSGGLDCSPRGDAGWIVHVENERTLMLPDRRGNNRIDSLRNIIENPQVALLFLIPGIGETLRVNGRAAISIDPALLERFTHEGKRPRSVLAIAIGTVYFQCSRALVRSDLWNPAKHRSRPQIPSPGQMLAGASDARVGGDAYDEALPERMRTTLY
ncbi:MAG TPA: pyridoxamine 5'-phosphate oxidase family protein [Microvirga sp.]|jgi:PPOX class probable FMN-dependent enzyme